MAKPIIPYWDKNLTHLIAPVAGHINNGYGLTEVPAANEFNGQLNQIGLSLAYHQQRLIVDALREMIPLLDPTDAAQKDPEMVRQSVATDCIYALALSGGSAYLKQGSANNKVKIAPGVLLQLRGGELYAYEFAGTDEFTIANGDATDPRVDLLQIQIDRDGVTMAPTVALTVKQGTPAASPAYPAPDANTCVVGAVVVGATYTGAAGLVLGEDTAGAVAVLHDQRVPLGVRPVTTLAKQMMFGTDWVLDLTDTCVRKTNNTASNALFVPCAFGGYTGRVLGFTQMLASVIGQDARFCRLKYYDIAGTASVGDIDLADAKAEGSAASPFSRRSPGILNFQQYMTPSAGPTVTANANGMGAPIWTNGRRCPTAPTTDLSDSAFPVSQSILVVKYTSPGGDSGTVFGPGTFWVAGGL